MNSRAARERRQKCAPGGVSSGMRTPEIQAKLIALKAFRIGALARARPNRRPSLAATARRALTSLQRAEESEQRSRRGCFYALVLAELARGVDEREALEARRAARHYAKDLVAVGDDDPLEVFHAIVAATTRRLSAGDFGDFTTAAHRSRVLASNEGIASWEGIDLASRASGISPGMLSEADRRFLDERSLDEIAASHGLA